MSKTFRAFLFVLASFVQILYLFNNSNAQDIEASIKIDSESPQKVAIQGRFLSPNAGKNLSFLQNYGHISRLAERISNVVLFDENDIRIKNRRMIWGEYLANEEFTKWSYEVDLTPLKQPSAAAHVSWLDNGGILMLADLLPQLGKKKSAKIKVEIPNNWTLVTNEIIDGPSVFRVRDIEKAVIFLVGLHDNSRHISKAVDLNISDSWLFSEMDAKEIAESIFGEYGRIFHSVSSGPVLIGIRKYPLPTTVDNWEADTRGRTITIVSSDTPFRSQSIQRLHEQLRHEMFHLWIPNGVSLTGNYDWFYEGFALYQSLNTGVALNRIRFDDYLDTLSRAYDIDRAQKQKVSLIEASKNRWVDDNNTRVYARGMLVAFLCDLALLEKSKGKRSVTDILRKLYEDHRPPSAEMDGNTAVLELLRSHDELRPIIDRNITGSESVDWNDLIKAAGLETDPTTQTTNLKVTAKPSGRQKDLLDKLGYNNWRKLSSK